jgi:hypothetical protein
MSAELLILELEVRALIGAISIECATAEEETKNRNGWAYNHDVVCENLQAEIRHKIEDMKRITSGGEDLTR